MMRKKMTRKKMSRKGDRKARVIREKRRSD